MKTNRIISLLFATLFFVSGCRHSEIPTYNSKYDAVRFPYRTSNNNEPSGYDYASETFVSNFSFLYHPEAQSYDYHLPVVLIGKVADMDRVVTCTVDEEKSDAPTGSYQILPGVIPAMSREGYILIRLIKDESIKEKDHTLTLNLTTSDDLTAGPAPFITARLSWGDRLPLPVKWQHCTTYNMLIEGSEAYNSSSDEYISSAGLSVIVNAFGWDNWDDDKIHGNAANGAFLGKYKYLPRYQILNPGQLYKVYAMKLADYIKSYNQSHPDRPLIHDGGKNVGLPIEARKY